MSCPKSGTLGLFFPFCFGRLLKVIWFPLNPQFSQSWAISSYAMSVEIRSPVSAARLPIRESPAGTELGVRQAWKNINSVMTTVGFMLVMRFHVIPPPGNCTEQP